jgi:hypothetical protein
MRARRPLPRWVIVVAFAVIVVAVTLASRLLHPPTFPPRTLGELTERLRRSDPPLYVVPMADHSPEEGVYICERPRPREQLQWLRRSPEHAARWRGVVYCERAGGVIRVPEDQLESWGEHGLRVGPFVLFGDPALLERIRETILKR